MGPGLLSLPEEVLCCISCYLNPRDLLALSATCHQLRSNLNNKWVWSKHTAREEIGLLLVEIPSVVDPTFSTKHETTTLEPLCKERTSFLNQSRLISNIRLGRSVEKSIPFQGYISDFETCLPLNNRKVTYNNVYLFALDYCEDEESEIITVFHIESTPYVVTSFKLLSHESYAVILNINVFGQKLAVRNDDWYDIYEIKLPDLEFPLLYSLKIKDVHLVGSYNVLVSCNILFVENVMVNAIHIWDLDRGTKISDISPPNKEMDFMMLNYPRNQNRSVLLCMAFSSQKTFSPRLFLYDVDLLQFTHSLALNRKVVEDNNEWFGLVEEKHVVLLAYKTSFTCSVFVFDCNISNLTVEKHNLDGNSNVQPKIIKDCLVLPALVNVKIMELKSLTILWEIQIETGIIPEVPQTCMIGVDYIDISTLDHLIIIYKLGGVEVWDFEMSTKLLDLLGAKSVTMNDTYSKLICCLEDTMKVKTFW